MGKDCFYYLFISRCVVKKGTELTTMVSWATGTQQKTVS